MTIGLGILSLSDRQIDPQTNTLIPQSRRIDDIIVYAELADRLGLDVFGLGEHHARDFAVSSPPVVRAAIAARTQKIRLASAVTVLSCKRRDPLRKRRPARHRHNVWHSICQASSFWDQRSSAERQSG